MNEPHDPNRTVGRRFGGLGDNNRIRVISSLGGLPIRFLDATLEINDGWLPPARWHP
jgi:hypothetical protein